MTVFRKNIFLYFIFAYQIIFLEVCHSLSEDDQIIQKLLNAPGSENTEDSQAVQILKRLEVEAQTENMPTTTTPMPSPFFQTPSPTSKKVNETDLDELISYLKEIETGSPKWKRSSSHEPPLEHLLWGTAKAVWDISRPSFFKTGVGRKVSVLRDTLTLPLRTFGHIKSEILDLTNPDRRRHFHYPAESHGWGWDPKVYYVKYEPDNSLFKSWIRFIFKTVGPAIKGKVRLKSILLKIKLQLLRSLLDVLRTAKTQKLLTTIRTIGSIVVKKVRPKLIVLKETGHADKPSLGAHGWVPVTKAAPIPSYGPPGYTPPAANPGNSYGPPAENPGNYYGPPPAAPPSNSYGPSQPATPPENSYGLPQPATPPENSYGPPQNFYVAPDMTYGPPDKSHEGYQHYLYSYATSPPPSTSYGSRGNDAWGSSSSQIEVPSYAKYLKQLGIDPSDSDGNRNLRQLEKDEDVPYLVEESEESSSDDNK